MIGCRGFTTADRALERWDVWSRAGALFHATAMLRGRYASRCLAAPLDRVKPLPADDGAARPDETPVGSKLHSGLPVRNGDPGIGGEAGPFSSLCWFCMEVEGDFGISRTVERPELLGTNDPRRGAAPHSPELTDATHDQLTVGLFRQDRKSVV